MELYQLPNGNWISPAEVVSVVALKSDKPFLGDDRIPDRVVVRTREGNYEVIECDSYQMAQTHANTIGLMVSRLAKGQGSEPDPSRLHIAAMAMQGLVTKIGLQKIPTNNYEWIAASAVELADELIAAAKKG